MDALRGTLFEDSNWTAKLSLISGSISIPWGHRDYSRKINGVSTHTLIEISACIRRVFYLEIFF